jgi:hypothetical protein
MADNFRAQILNNKEAASIQTPVRTLGSVTFMYLRHNDLYVLMVTRNNANVMLAFKFMSSVRRLARSRAAWARGHEAAAAVEGTQWRLGWRLADGESGPCPHGEFSVAVAFLSPMLLLVAAILEAGDRGKLARLVHGCFGKQRLCQVAGVWQPSLVAGLLARH